MDRRKFVSNGFLTAAMISMSPAEIIASLYQQPAFKIQMLTDNTGIFTERGGAILFSFTKDGIVVVDSQFPDQAGHLIAELKQRKDQPFRLLINTHHHPDHSGGNIAFKGLVQHVVAHENSKVNQQKQAVQRKNEDQQLYPDQLFGTKWCEKIGSQQFCLHYFGPGHTNGDAIVHLQRENIAHMGDLCFKYVYPNLDAAAGGSMKNWILVLDKIYKLLDRKTKVICSHGNPPDQIVVDREFLKEQQGYFEKVLEFVGKEIKSGKTKEEIILNKIIPGVDKWSEKSGFAKVNLTVAFDEITAGS